MRRVAELGFLLVVVVLSAALTRQPIGLETPVELRGQFGRDQAIALVAQRAGLEVIGNLEGQVNLDLTGASALQALDEIVGRDEWKLVGRQLLLIPVRDIRGEYCGQEFLLEGASARELLPLMQRRFPTMVLRLHPKLNGFYCVGSLVDLLAFKRLLAAIDQTPVQSGPLPFQPNTQDDSIIRALESEFPDVSFTRGADGWMATAPLSRQLEVVDRADRLQRTHQAVAVRGRLQPGCRLDSEWDVYHISCSPGCQGPLHQLGLEPGDILTLGWTRLERAQPRWRLTRGHTKLLLDLAL